MAQWAIFIVCTMRTAVRCFIPTAVPIPGESTARPADDHVDQSAPAQKTRGAADRPSSSKRRERLPGHAMELRTRQNYTLIPRPTDPSRVRADTNGRDFSPHLRE